ncbi:MAG: aquaporin, partial [bacterium]
MMYAKAFAGEAIGTFVLTLFGCGAVAVSVLFNAHQGLMQVALAWGIGVTLAIYLTRHLSCAHLNPAVSIAMAVSGRMKVGKLPIYLAAQFLGAILAGLVIYAFFNPSIVAFEAAHQIVRGAPESIKTAMMFGEFYPNPGAVGAVVSLPLAMAVEAFATFLLVLIIFALTEDCNVGRPSDNSAPVFIGLTVTSLICLTAPLTQTG